MSQQWNGESLKLAFFFFFSIFFLSYRLGDFPGGPMAKILHSQCRWPRFDQGTRSHMLQLKILHSAMKT